MAVWENLIMKRSVWTAVLFAVSSVVVVGGMPGVASAQPVRNNDPASARNAPPIVFEPEVCDLGIGKPGEKMHSTITLRNTGTTPLKITRLKGSCSCTVPSISSDVIPPGETAEVTVEMDPGWLPSKIRKQVNVFAEGYTRPATVPVLAEVSFAVRVEKPSVKLSVNEPIAEVRIEAIDGTPFRILRVNGKEVDGKGTKVATDEAAKSHDIAYAFGEEEIPTYLVVETDHPEGSVLAVRMEHPAISKREMEPESRDYGLKTERHFMNIESVYPGETVEVVLPVSGLAEIDVPTVSVDDERLEVRYMGKTPHPEKRSWFNVKLFVTVKDRNASGMINTGFKLEVPDAKQVVHSFVIGSIRPASAAANKGSRE